MLHRSRLSLKRDASVTGVHTVPTANLIYGRPLLSAPRAPAVQAEVTTMGDISHSSCLPHLVGAAVVAELIGCSRKHVYDLAQKGQIPHYRIGGLIRFNLQEIADWLESQRIAA